MRAILPAGARFVPESKKSQCEAEASARREPGTGDTFQRLSESCRGAGCRMETLRHRGITASVEPGDPAVAVRCRVADALPARVRLSRRRSPRLGRTQRPEKGALRGAGWPNHEGGWRWRRPGGENAAVYRAAVGRSRVRCRARRPPATHNQCPELSLPQRSTQCRRGPGWWPPPRRRFGRFALCRSMRRRSTAPIGSAQRVRARPSL